MIIPVPIITQSQLVTLNASAIARLPLMKNQVSSRKGTSIRVR